MGKSIGERLAAARRRGEIAHDDQIASVRESVVASGRSRGRRAIDVTCLGGLAVRLLPDRGLDVANAWSGGLPIGWISPLGEGGPMDSTPGHRWLEGWGGGLVTTCGLRNAGEPAGDHGLHGRYHQLPAERVRITRELDGDDPHVAIEAIVREGDALGDILENRRIVRVFVGRPSLEIADATTNRGPTTQINPFLYHVNVGYPLLGSRSEVVIDSSEVLPRDPASVVALDSWTRPATPLPGGEMAVVEHVLAPDVERSARLLNPDHDCAVTVSWSGEDMRRLHQWLYPRPGVHVLGLEPANCSVLGRDHDASEGRSPTLEPGETRERGLRVDVGPID